MKHLGSTRPWPPEACDELRQHLAKYSWSKTDATAADDLFATVEELDGWLGDERPYTNRNNRKVEWSSLVEDTRAAFSVVGSELRSLLPSASRLLAGLHDELGPKKTDRDDLRAVLEQLRTELRDPDAPGAAFDDFVAAVQDPRTRANVIEVKVDLIDAVLRFSDRALRDVTSTLVGILDNDAFYVAQAHHLLDEGALPAGISKVDEDAGLSEQERLSLAHRFAGYRQQPKHHVVWVFYSHARLGGWHLRIGSVDFFNGPAITTAFARIEATLENGRDFPDVVLEFDNLPAELIGDEKFGKYVRSATGWPSKDAWVAVRVDLGVGPFYDVVEAAREQVRALLALALFGVGESSWTELTGYKHFVDGHESGSSAPFEEIGFWRRFADADYTHSWLYENQAELATRVTASPAMLHTPDVHAVVTATSVLAATAHAAPALKLLESVRVLETQAGVLRIHWTELVDRYANPGSALQRAQLGALQAIEAVTSDYDIHSHLPHLRKLSDEFRTYRDGQHVIDLSVAHERLPHLVDQLPIHNLPCRKLRDAADDLADPARVAAFVDRERDRDLRLLRRAHRIRNSLTHGGPSHPTAVRDSSAFITGKAKHVTGVNVRALLDGEPLATTLERYRTELARWISELPAGSDTAAALFPDKARGTT